MPTLKTNGEQLAEVQEAISAVMAGQSYRINGREVVRADLHSLQQREEVLLHRLETQGDVVASTKTNRGAYKVEFDG